MTWLKIDWKCDIICTVSGILCFVWNSVLTWTEHACLHNSLCQLFSYLFGYSVFILIQERTQRCLVDWAIMVTEYYYYWFSFDWLYMQHTKRSWLWWWKCNCLIDWFVSILDEHDWYVRFSSPIVQLPDWLICFHLGWTQ